MTYPIFLNSHAKTHVLVADDDIVNNTLSMMAQDGNFCESVFVGTHKSNAVIVSADNPKAFLQPTKCQTLGINAVSQGLELSRSFDSARNDMIALLDKFMQEFPKNSDIIGFRNRFSKLKIKDFKYKLLSNDGYDYQERAVRALELCLQDANKLSDAFGKNDEAARRLYQTMEIAHKFSTRGPYKKTLTDGKSDVVLQGYDFLTWYQIFPFNDRLNPSR